MNKPERPQVDQAERDQLIADVTRALARRCKKHGIGAFWSGHEGLGVVAEEYHELVEALRSNDRRRVRDKAMDVAIGCLWLVASLDATETSR